MEKILVTTDLSANSRAGMRYAIHLATERGAQLHFIYVDHVLRASMWSDKEYNGYVQQSKAAIMQQLPGFINEVYRSQKIVPGDHVVIVHPNLYTTEGILEYAAAENIDYICISTRGAGTLKKLFGTHTGELLLRAAIPVLCIPRAYRFKPVRQVLYATDMSDYANELPRIVAFAKPLNAAVEMLHLAYGYEMSLEKETMERVLQEKAGYHITLHYENRDLERSILQEIETAVKKSKPSVLALFTNQSRSFFERLIIGSNAQEFAFHATIPLLSFNRKTPKTSGL